MAGFPKTIVNAIEDQKVILQWKCGFPTEIIIRDRDSASQLLALCFESGLLPFVVKIDLQATALKELPLFLPSLPVLQSLDLSSNELSSLPEWIGQLKNLTNELTELPQWP